MEIVSKGSLQPVSRPASCEKRGKGVKRLPTGSSFEQLPPEAKPPSPRYDLDESGHFYDEDDDDEDYGYDDDDVLISQVEGDVNVEDVDTEVITRQTTSNEELSTDDEERGSRISVDDNSAETRIVGQGKEEEVRTPDVEQQMDPKIRKGLEKIKKLDQVLSEKIRKEKEVKTKRRLLEKLWREQNQEMEKIREEEGHGKMNLGVAHVLALGPPDDNALGESDDDMSDCVTPVFPTQPLVDEDFNKDASRRSSKDLKTPSSECSTDDQKSEKMHKKKKNSGAKHKRANFIKRNIALAADAGNVIPMTEEEKNRLEELLNEDIDQFVYDGGEGSVSDICVASGIGFLPDQESVDALSIIDHKLEALVPMDELDMLSEQGTWTPISESEVHSLITEGGDKKSFDSVDIGERVLREEKEMRDMKQRLLAIEHELQNLENSSGDESDVKLSREMLAKLIDDSSRTTSRSTTISETVLSNLSTPRHYLHNAPLGEIEEDSFEDDFSSRTSSRSLTASAKDTATNPLPLGEYMDSPVEESEEEDIGRNSSRTASRKSVTPKHR